MAVNDHRTACVVVTVGFIGSNDRVQMRVVCIIGMRSVGIEQA